MLCSIIGHAPENFFAVWFLIAVAAMATVFLMTAITFRWLYANATYEKWLHKSNAVYPTAVSVREEIIQTAKAVMCVTVFPALAVYFRQANFMNGYCPQDSNYEEMSSKAFHPFVQFFLIVLITDFYEFFYHWCGHWFDAGWAIHRHHHKYYNPTPFAVIADDWWDNIWRAFPLFLFPIAFTMHIEVLWYTFMIFFYCYGIYLHSGYEADWIVSAKNPFVNTSFQHYIHHAAGTRKRPCHCGFFIKVWDNIWGTVYDGPECHAEAERAKGKRSREEWEKIAKDFPNYSLLVSPSFMWDPKGTSNVTMNILKVLPKMA